MRSINLTQASKAIEKIIYETSVYHEPIQIKGKNGINGILISEDDWRAISETLYLLSIPGMRESINKGLNTPIDKTSNKLNW
ncbi:MAG: antitoxin [Bacteroidetes bacterium GWA2_32_17]|nr:MAG: antitoxin [Bacteroidetes bacterium GWA2_32_17]